MHQTEHVGLVSDQRTVQAEVVCLCRVSRKVYGVDRSHDVHPRGMAQPEGHVLQDPRGLLGFLRGTQLQWALLCAG